MTSRRTPLTLALAATCLIVAAVGSVGTVASSLTTAAAPGGTGRSVAVSDLPDRIDAFVVDYLDTHRVPGASVAVVHDGEVVHEAGYGVDGDGRQVTADTRMPTSSISKSFTAFLVLRQVARGTVDLDRPVTELLPELRIDDPRSANITVRHLLSHTSGLPNPVVVGPADTLRAGVARLADWRLDSDPGTTYSYSNANYWVLARMVEVLEQRPYGTALRDEVLDPLGMGSSEDVVTTADVPADVPAGHVLAYGAAFATSEPRQMVDGAGGLVSTAHDLGRWLAAQQRGGVTDDGTQLLPRELVAQSHDPAPGTDRYGLGWQLSQEHPGRVGHSGAAATTGAQQTLDEETGWGVAVLVGSGSPVREHAYALDDGILALTAGEQPEVGAPVPMLIDLALGALSLTTLGLGVLGVRRAGRWASRRRTRGVWWFGARLLPQLVGPALAAGLFVVAPGLQDNSLTATDVVRLFPALAVLVLALGVTGAGVSAARVVSRIRRSD